VATADHRQRGLDADVVVRPRDRRQKMSGTIQTLGPAFDPEDKNYEVVNGLRTELPPMSARETGIASRILRLMGGEALTQGEAYVEMLFQIDPDNDLQRRPDVAFVSFARWPEGEPVPTTNAWEVVPDLAVEVVSPTNGFNEILTKVDDYLRCGVRLVWVVLPLFERVYVYTSPTAVRILTRDDALDAGDVITGVRIPLAAMFRRARPSA
jgi:Uma2 family endonuclease